MNCCDAFGNCNQGRDCPVRALKHPRTLNEAFGPYTSNEIPEPRNPKADYPWTWWALMAAIGLVALALAIGGA